MSSSQAWWDPQSSPRSRDAEPQRRPSATTPLPEPEKMDLERLSMNDDALPTRRIHVMGLGSIGCLVAHSLNQLPNPPPISLLVHREEKYTDFKKAGRIVRLTSKAGDVNDEQTGFDVDVLRSRDSVRGTAFWEHIPHEKDSSRTPTNPINENERMENDETFIYNLIVTVKGPHTKRALQDVAHRVGPQTTILFMQNGLGQIDELNQLVFKDPATRPTYLVGIIAHGCYLSNPFSVVHAGVGSVAIGVYRDRDKFPMPRGRNNTVPTDISEEERKAMYPTDEELYSNITSRYLLRTMTRCPTLACAAYPYLDVFQLQLEKLVTNCIINPLTALLDIQNGATLGNPPLTRVQRLLISEIALVLQGLPELAGLPNLHMRFSPTRLEMRVQTMAIQTAQNSSSMREDMRYKQGTEIDYINAYIVKRGEQQGIKCVLNYMLAQLIKSKSHIIDVETGRERPQPYGVEDIRAEPSQDTEGAVVLEDFSPPRG